MGIIGKLETEVDIKSSGDLYHELFGSKPHHVSNITPDKVQACKLHEGEYGNHGSVVAWHYTHLDGKQCVAKCIVGRDEDKKLTSFKVIEGNLLEDFKNFTAYVQVIPQGEITAVKWIAEFEKINDDGPYPTDLMDLWIALTRDIESHHLNA